VLFVNTTDKLQLITTSAAPLDVLVEYADMDNSSKAVTVSRQATKISSATTTDIMAAPASGFSRRLIEVNINNTSATTANTVTAQYNANATLYQIDSWILAVGERVRYNRTAGWQPLDSAGRIKVPGLGLPNGNSNTADVVASAADTYLAGSALQIGGRIQAATYAKFRLRVTKTAAGIVAPVFSVRLGTAGSTADTARTTLTGAAQTAATDTGDIEIDVWFTAVGASGVVRAEANMLHTSANGAGLGTFQSVLNTSASFDTTTAGLILGLSVNPGSAGVWTFQKVIAELGNTLS
jgi:hypothetical protein